MADADYYSLLGVERDATLQQIRTKFRQKVLAEHPDKGGDPIKFQLLSKAYNVLTDQEKRRRYDTTGRAEKTAEEEFVDGFAGGRLRADQQRSKDADSMAVVNLQDRIVSGNDGHEAGFAEWLRQRDQSEMVLTDTDFMKTALYNAAELSSKVRHTGPVHCVLGSPSDSIGQGAIQVQAKQRPVQSKSINHDEVLVRMLAVPVDDSMVYAELGSSTGVCLGMTGVGRIEQAGARVEELRQEDSVIVLPKPTKFSSQRPIGTARTLLVCTEEDVIRIPNNILEELSPEQICLTPTIVCAYILLEQYGSKLKPGDSVLLNAAHLSSSGSSLLQLCLLLKLKPLCLLSLPGAPKTLVNGEYGSKAAWQEVESRPSASASVRAQYERISESLVAMGAEEVFPDAAALLRWRDRNQRMLPKLALDGLAREDSCEQLIHCLQPGDKDAQLVVYGHGVAQPLKVSPPLLASWGGAIVGFNIARWVHGLSANVKKMMTIMENITKLVRSNKFTLETALYNVGSDPVSDAFTRARDIVDNAQVVLTFPTLQEEMGKSQEEQRHEQKRQEQRLEEERKEQERRAKQTQENLKKQDIEDEREKLKREWLDLLFTEQSVAAISPEGPLPVAYEAAGSLRKSSSLVVWIGDSPNEDSRLIKDLQNSFGAVAVLSLAWPDHPAGEALKELELAQRSDVLDGTWYTADRARMQNEDLDILHDVESLGRAFIESVKLKLDELRLTWRNVVIAGFGKGAGVALSMSLLRLFPEQVGSLVLFAPIVPFPVFLGEKMQQATTSTSRQTVKVFTVWGSRDKLTPSSYRQLLAQTLRKAREVHYTPDTLPDADHSFTDKGYGLLESLLQLCLPR